MVTVDSMKSSPKRFIRDGSRVTQPGWWGGGFRLSIKLRADKDTHVAEMLVVRQYNFGSLPSFRYGPEGDRSELAGAASLFDETWPR